MTKSFTLFFLVSFVLPVSFLCQSVLLKSTTYKSEQFELAMGGTVTIIGAPEGSISIEGWQKNEILVEAEIELQAQTETDLKMLSSVTGFVLDKDFNHAKIISVGTHDREYLRRVARKFPKKLIGLPFRIDYKIKVPRYCDLEINGGRGDLDFNDIDGSILIKFIEAKNAKLNVSGGSIDASFGSGRVEVNLLAPSWRGRFLNVSLIKGSMQVVFPSGMNAELDASILRDGKIENQLQLKPKNEDQVSERKIAVRIGNGGAPLIFRVVSGTIKIFQK